MTHTFDQFRVKRFYVVLELCFELLFVELQIVVVILQLFSLSNGPLQIMLKHLSLSLLFPINTTLSTHGQHN